MNSLFKSVNCNLNSVESSMVLFDAFYRHFNMYEDTVESRLIGPVLYKENEVLTRPKRLVGLIDAYIDKKIGDTFNLSITDFMRLSFLEIKLLLESAEDYIKTKNEMLTDINLENKKDMEDLLNG